MAKAPNSRRNLDMAIRRAFGDGRYVRMRTLIANTVVAQMLPDGVVKGGSALKMRLGDAGTRFTADLDTAAASSVEAYVQELEEALARGWGDFTGTVVVKKPPHPKGVPFEYVMRPYDVKLSYRGQPWCTVRVEVGHNEIGDADQADITLADDVIVAFERLGLPAPNPVPLMVDPYQIAQKLHGLTAAGSDRARDLVDLQLCVFGREVDYGQTRLICERLFSYRRSQVWPPTLVKGDRWDELYDAESEGLDVLPDIDAAVDWVNHLIEMIASAGSASSDDGESPDAMPTVPISGTDTAG